MKTKILCIHGIGGKDATINEWRPLWESQILKSSGLKHEQVEFNFLEFDFIFEKHKKEGIPYVKGILRLMKDWAIDAIFGKSRSFGLKESIRWYAGMVVQFTENKELRLALKNYITPILDGPNKPDIIYSHSLGTLIIYDILLQEAAKGQYRNLNLITSGSQIGHPALRRFFGGAILPLKINKWINFHNSMDMVFAYESIRVNDTRFNEIDTTFNEPGSIINHEALNYIGHTNSILLGWPDVLKSLSKGKRTAEASNFAKESRATYMAAPKGISKSTTKVLLVGINDYPNPDNQLYGCVNDVFRMSEVLQEMGVKPEEIKVVLNENATSGNLRGLMDWLLKDAKSGDNRFFYYSGHGAQIPSAGISDDLEDDHLEECLVTYDFNWERANAYTDKEFLKSYSQLPFGVNFTVVLDCCHSGGIARDGLFKARGLNLPDDIRHSVIKWDSKRQMWIPRKMKLSTERIFDANQKEKELYTGSLGGTQRFGRGIALWSDNNTWKENKRKYGTNGAYMPLIIEACREEEYSYEYKHGVTSYGAFTYSLTTILREINRAKKYKNLTYKKLVELAAKQLKELEFQQNPQIIGPKAMINEIVPFLNL